MSECHEVVVDKLMFRHCFHGFGRSSCEQLSINKLTQHGAEPTKKNNHLNTRPPNRTTLNDDHTTFKIVCTTPSNINQMCIVFGVFWATSGPVHTLQDQLHSEENETVSNTKGSILLETAPLTGDSNPDQQNQFSTQTYPSPPPQYLHCFLQFFFHCFRIFFHFFPTSTFP